MSQCPAAAGPTRLWIEDGTFPHSRRETGAKNAGRPWPQGAVGVGSGCSDEAGVCAGRPASCSGTCGAAGWCRPALRKPGGGGSSAGARAPRGPARVAIWGLDLGGKIARKLILEGHCYRLSLRDSEPPLSRTQNYPGSEECRGFMGSQFTRQLSYPRAFWIF